MKERKQDDPHQSIDPDDPAQLHYWLTSLAVTEAQLKAAVQAVGGEPGKVREYLGKTVARP
jgi:hypothetical protein